jgi:hypothetical protein
MLIVCGSRLATSRGNEKNTTSSSDSAPRPIMSPTIPRERAVRGSRRPMDDGGTICSGGDDSGSNGCCGGTSKFGSGGNEGSLGGGPNILERSVIGPVCSGSSTGTGIGVGRSGDGS